MNSDPDPELELSALIDRLSLEEKVRVLTGGSAWSTAALPTVGLRAMVLSDGPSGVRGASWDERDPSLCLPSGTALSASWDLELAWRYGAVAAAEARRKGVDVILGPTLNLHRSPLGGRHFEAFSEDPVLTADLAAAYVRGVQAHGVGAAVKHYVANDFETDRFNADVRVGDRALRELYLLAFERAVTDAHAWLVMSAYNAVNGVTATENALLTDPLTTTWGFDGVVVSDWTAVRSLESARHPQDLAMPGPEGPWGEHLVAAVRSGDVDEHVVDQKVRRILRLASRVGALDGHEPRPVGETEDGPAFARLAAREGMVLVRNEGLLPLTADSLTRVAVIGPHADHARVQGGGSATVVPPYTVSPLAGLRAVLPGSVVVDHVVGAPVEEAFRVLDPALMVNPVTGAPGAHVAYQSADGAAELFAEERGAAFILDFGRPGVGGPRASMTFATTYTPAESGELQLGFASPGTGRLFVDGALVLEATLAQDSDQVQAFFFPPSVAVPVAVTAGRSLGLRYEFVPGAVVDGVPDSLTVSFGTEPTPRTEEEQQASVERAVAAARAADVAVVVVGTSAEVECEGYDRSDLRLPGRQDELVSAVAAANPRTVVVVNAGAPVEMPWREEVAAVLLTWFGGQEFGHALADVLLGDAEPGGRLPTTWPRRLSDLPVVQVTPVDGVLVYDEGIHIGYRAWLKAGTEPAYPFGHGLGYTRWRLGPLRHVGRAEPGGPWRLAVAVTNTGPRPGKQVVQLYARRPSSAVERPLLWLVGFAVVRAAPGETVEVEVGVAWRAFAHWDDGWSLEPGGYQVLAGTSASDLGEPVLLSVGEG